METELFALRPLRHRRDVWSRFSLTLTHTHSLPTIRGNDLLVSVQSLSLIFPGSEVTVFYDPLIAKIITHGPTRAGIAPSLQFSSEYRWLLLFSDFFFPSVVHSR